MSSSNEPVRIKRELPSDDDDEIKLTVQSGTASSSFLYQPVKQEQFDESESKPIHQLEATFSFAGPVKHENVHVKQENKKTSPSAVCHVFGHMAKCTLGNQCTTPNCSTLKAMANHLFDCARPDCSVCGPFQPQSNNPLPQFSDQSIPAFQIHVPSPNIFQNTFSQAQTAQSSSGSQTNSTEQFDFLLNKLKNSKNNPNAYKETQQQVLAILNANPNLLDTFIERRQELQQLQPQQQSQSSFNQSHNPLPQIYRQPVPATRANVLSPNIPQPKCTFPPQASSTPTQALQQLLTTLRNTNNSPQARQQVLNILKAQPALMATFIKQRQQQQQQLQHFQSSINQSNNQPNNPLFQASHQPVPRAQVNPPNPNIFQSQSLNPQVSVTQPRVPGSQTNFPLPQSNTSQPQVSGLQPYAIMTPTESLQQLLTTLRNTNNSPQAQQQVLNILKSQPALMATYIKQRQQQQQQLERQRELQKQQQHD